MPAPLDVDTNSSGWSRAAVTWISKDCSKTMDYPKLRTQVRAFWTDSDLYLLFICPYQKLNLFLPADTKRARSHLWDRDVVEIFLGDDWEHIRQYREFEVAPTGDWIDLAIDLDRDLHDESWRSGWQTSARIDPKAHVWLAAARIPLTSIHGDGRGIASPLPNGNGDTARASETARVHAGTRWRMNLYRTDGLGSDPQRHFMCWQPTCVTPDRDPNHVPENFGSLIFAQ